MDALATGEGEEIRRRVSVSRDTLLRVAWRDAQSADAATGRGVTTAHATIAAELGMAKKTVERARQIVQELGYAVTILEGSYLTRSERKAAHEHHGGWQLRAASTRALTVPKGASHRGSVENVDLPRRGSVLTKSHPLKRSPKRASARSSAAAQPKAAGMTEGGRRGRARRAETPRPIDLQRLARDVDERLPWVCRGRHIGHLASVLDRAGVDPCRWTAGDLVAAVERFEHQVGGRLTAPKTERRDPLGFFAWLLRMSVDPTVPTVSELREIARSRKLEEQRRRRAQAAAEEARAASLDDPEIRAILAAMKADAAAAAERHRARLRGQPVPPDVTAEHSPTDAHGAAESTQI